MIKILGLATMLLSAYGLDSQSLDLWLVQSFFIGLFMYFSEELVDLLSIARYVKVRDIFEGLNEHA